MKVPRPLTVISGDDEEVHKTIDSFFNDVKEQVLSAELKRNLRECEVHYMTPDLRVHDLHQLGYDLRCLAAAVGIRLANGNLRYTFHFYEENFN